MLFCIARMCNAVIGDAKLIEYSKIYASRHQCSPGVRIVAAFIKKNCLAHVIMYPFVADLCFVLGT